MGRWTQYGHEQLPAFENKLKFAENAALGVRRTKSAATWYLRVYDRPGKHHFYYSTNVPYEEGYASERVAKEAAAPLYERANASIKAGIYASIKISPEFIRQQYLQDIEIKSKANQKLIDRGLLPLHTVDGGRGFWDMRRFGRAKREIGRTISEIAEERTRGVENKFGLELWFDELPKELYQIKQKDLENFRTWAQLKYDWAPGTVNSALVQLRMIWRHAYNNEWVDFIPRLQIAPMQLVERSRRKLQPEEYRLLVETSRERYQSILRRPPEERDEVKLDQYYMFHMWILIMANCGIRPPGGKVERLLLRWSDIQSRTLANGQEERFLLRRSEKAHNDYEAIILPNAHQYLDAVKDLQERRGIDTPYIFAHTFDSFQTHKGDTNTLLWRKGDPIKSNKGQWNSLLRLCNLDSPVGTPQYQRVTPYALRAYFITKRMESSDTLRIEDLAGATGTSPRIIKLLYYDYDTRKRVPELVKGTRDRSSFKPVYKEGYYIGREEQ